MTVHQLHYTSCEDGLEGIQGFQVSAMTPGAPTPLVELAVRSSSYEAGPGLVSHLGDGDLARFPVALGYVPAGRAAALFESRYAGTDFTGRAGNYFAHALLLEDVEHGLGGLLPIDLWRSPAWAGARQGSGTTLPELATLPPGTAADLPSTRRFLAADGRAETLERVLGAVQRALTEDRGRLVLVVPDAHDAALWLAAVCRSLPRAMSLRVSFVTYTSRPENQDVLVSCTTPDVRLPSYGGFTVLDVTADSPGARGASRDSGASGGAPGGGTRYAAALARAWRLGQAEDAVRLAEQVDPALTTAELEAFAVVLETTMDLPVAVPAGEELTLDAVILAAARLPDPFTTAAWERVADQVLDAGGPQDLSRWAAVLRSALDRRHPVPSTLLGTYCIAVLKAPDADDAGGPRWLPQLGTADLDDIAENVVLPALTGTGPTAMPRRLGTRPDLLDALIRVLDRRLTDHREVRRLASALPPAVAQQLSRAGGAGGRLTLLTDLVLARDGQADRAAVLVRAARGGVAGWQQLDEILWPAVPPADEAVRTLRSLPADVLVATRLVARLVERVLHDAQRGELPPKDLTLVDELLRSPGAGGIAPGDAVALRAVRLTEQLRGATPKRHAERDLAAALDVIAEASGAIGERLVDGTAAFVLRSRDPATHADLLELALSARPARFMATYGELARGDLAKAAPDRVAGVIVVWESLSDQRTRRDLIEKTLPKAVARRGGKHLDKVGAALESIAGGLGQRAPKRSGGWDRWWLAWRMSHERRGLFGLLRRGRK